MNSGSAQDVAVEHFLQDIERRGNRLHCAVIGREGQNPHSEMNLLYRKSRLDWRHRDSDSSKKSSGSKDSSATVGKVRDLASFRRHFRMGFMTMPASQDLSPRPCSSAMAPRSQSCHSVGTGGDSLENGDHSSPHTSAHSSGRRPPAKPKRHPSTRLSSTADHRGTSLPLPPPEAPPPPPPTQLPAKHSDKRNAMKKSDSGDMSGRKVPPLKPKRSPNTQLSFDPPPPRLAPPPTPLPRPSQEMGGREEDEEDEPVYIEMVGRAFSQRDSQNATPHPATATTTPDSDSDESEAIYEEMKYPLPEESEPRHRLPPKHDRPGASKSSKAAHPSASHSSSASLPHHSSSSSSSKPKATVSISHSSPLPSSSSSTPVPQALASGPQPPRAPTPFLLPGSKSQADTSNKIPAPFPNLLQHRPPLLAFPQPAAASSGIGIQAKVTSAKLGTVSTQASSSLAPPSNTSSSTAATSSSSKLPVLQLGPKEASGGSSGGQDKQQSEGKDSLLGPAPGLRARSHSTPLPPSSQSSSHYAHYHHHSHHHPSHYHHYRRADKELPTSHSMKLGPQVTAQAQTQTQSSSGGKESKSVGFLLKSEKRERDRERERERESGAHSATPSQSTPTPTPNTSTPQTSTSSAPSPAPASHSSSSQRPSSRPLLYRSHTPHPLSHGLPAYHPPPPDSPMLWTYPSVGLKRPPAYDSLRGGQLHSPHPQIAALSSGGSIPKSSSAPTPPQPGKVGGRGGQGDTGSLSRDGSGGGASLDEGPYWPMQRKMSFSHGIRETEKESSRVWNGSTDALPRVDKEDRGGLGGLGGVSGIPVRLGGSSGGGSGEGTGGGGAGPSTGLRALGRSGLPLPCQTFPACHRNGELGRLGRSASTSGVRQGSSNVQRQCSLPREALSQVQSHPQSQPPCTPTTSHQQQQLQLHQQQLQQQLQLHLQYQHLAHLSQCQPPTSGGSTSQAQAQTQRDGKLLEVIERKRCLCKEIKAHRRPERSLCKQDSMPILPSWRRTPEPRKTGTPPCQRQQAVVWDTAI